MLLLILLFHFLLFGYSSSDDKLCGIDSFIDLSLNDIDIEEVLYDRKSEGTLANLKCDGDPKVLEYFNVTAYDTDFLIQSTAKLADVDINTKKQKESMVSFTVDCNMTCNGNSIKVGIQFIVFDTNNHAPQFLKKEYIYRVASPIMPFGDFTDFGEKLIAEDIDFSNQGMTFTVDPDDFIVTTVVDEKQYTASFSAKKIIQITNPLTYKIVATDKGNEKTLSTSTEVTVQVDPSKSLDTPSFQNPSYSFDYSVKNKIVTLTPRNGPIKLTTNKPSEVIHLSLTGAYRENFAAKFNTKDNTVKLTATPISSDSSFTILTLSAETDAVASTSIVVYLTPAEESTPKFSNHFYSGSYTTNNTIVLDQKIVATAKKGTPIVTLAGDFSDHFKIDLTNGSYTITVSKKLTGSDVKSLTHLTFTLTATLAEITDQAALIIKLPEHQLLFTNNLYDATYDADSWGMVEKRLNLTDAAIQIRILKALEDVRPFGVFKHFYMAKVVGNLKQPNIIEAKHIWEYLDAEYDVEKYDERANAPFKNVSKTFDQIFDE